MGRRWEIVSLLALYSWISACQGAKNVHIVFSNHLDVGFNIQGDSTPGTDLNVINKYFDEYFALAAATAKTLRERGQSQQYKWMTHSWLVSLFLDCPLGMDLHCPNATSKAAFEAEVRAGGIHWHAMPFNGQVEMFDKGLLQSAVRLSHDLDARFGLPPKTTMSLRDVPGFTRGAIPILAQAGVAAVSVGVNGGSAPPGVPKNTPFVWHDTLSDAQLLAFWHPGGYSGQPVDQGPECVTAEGFDHVLCNAWRQDNAGPHHVDEVEAIFNLTEHNFPGAEVVASTLDAYVEALHRALPRLKLPVVTQEIGDTWVYGVASDAGKVKEYWALLQLRAALAPRHAASPHFLNFTRLLMKVPEHTWGLDIKTSLADFENWTNVALESQLGRRDARYLQTVAQWQRQRRYLRWALEALQPLRPQLPDTPEAMWEALKGTNEPPDLEGLAPVDGPLEAASPSWVVELDGTGGFTRLQRRHADGSLGTNWAGGSLPFAAVQYSTYIDQDFNVIWENYTWVANAAEWFLKDFGKPNVSLAHPKRADLLPEVVTSSVAQDTHGFKLIAKSTFPRWAVAEAGAPQAIVTEVKSRAGAPELLVDVTWVKKTPTRLPEALWVRFSPSLHNVDPSTWRMHKLGQPISPLDVILNGSQSQHAVSFEGVTVLSKDHSEQLSIRSLDAPLVSPGRPTPFPIVREKPDVREGMSFNLANNIWGTNYIMWQPYAAQDDTIRFRFTIRAKQHDTSEPDSLQRVIKHEQSLLSAS